VLRLFWEFFKLALCVIGGGYAILVVADDWFGRRLKWLREGELLDHLPVFQMVPGLIAGNTAIYVGLKRAGRLGACVALLGVALPSFLVFLAVTCAYAALPLDDVWLKGLFLGLRSALTGLLLATLVKTFRRNVVGTWGAFVLAASLAFLVAWPVNPAFVLLAAMAAGIARAYVLGLPPHAVPDDAGVACAPLSPLRRCALAGGVLAALGFGAWICWPAVREFVVFGCLGFGGGYVLVPMYLREFIGASAPYLQLPAAEFSDLMALTQMTPGPVSVNAATFFGYRLGGVAGAAIATAALLLPSFFLLTTALAGLEKWKRSRFVQGLLFGVRPATTGLLAAAAWAFLKMSVWTVSDAQWTFHPVALVLVAATTALFRWGRISPVRIILCAAAIGLAAAAFGA